MEDDLENDTRYPVIRSLLSWEIANSDDNPMLGHHYSPLLCYKGPKTDLHTMDEFILAYGTYFYGIFCQILWNVGMYHLGVIANTYLGKWETYYCLWQTSDNEGIVSQKYVQV